jgi:hypothetical protein
MLRFLERFSLAEIVVSLVLQVLLFFGFQIGAIIFANLGMSVTIFLITLVWGYVLNASLMERHLSGANSLWRYWREITFVSRTVIVFALLYGVGFWFTADPPMSGVPTSRVEAAGYEQCTRWLGMSITSFAMTYCLVVLIRIKRLHLYKIGLSYAPMKLNHEL